MSRLESDVLPPPVLAMFEATSSGRSETFSCHDRGGGAGRSGHAQRRRGPPVAEDRARLALWTGTEPRTTCAEGAGRRSSSSRGGHYIEIV